MTEQVKDLYEKLQSGEELFFVTGYRISSPKWYRSPMRNKEETIELFLNLMNDPDIGRVSVYCESDLNKLNHTFDEENSEWVESWITKRECLFGSDYQDRYELFCKESGVNLELISEWVTLRDEKQKEVLKNQEKVEKFDHQGIPKSHNSLP